MKTVFLFFVVLGLAAAGCGSDDPVAPSDDVDPTVSLSASEDSLNASGPLVLTATASDDVGVTRVDFYDESALLGSDSTAPFTHTVNITPGDNGDHSYSAVARDAAGNTGTSGTVAVNVAIPTLPLSDDFNDNAINELQWSHFAFGNATTVEEVNQRFEVFFPGTESATDFAGSLIADCRIIGDYDIRVDYELLEWPANNGVRIGLYGGSAVAERVSFKVGEFNSQESYVADHWGSVTTLVTGDTSGTLRAVRSGDTWSSYYRDGSDWVLIKETARSETGGYSIILSAWSHSSVFLGQDVRLAFDNFRIVSGTPETCEE